MRLDQRYQFPPGRHLLHLGEEFLTPVALLGCGLLVISESELIAAHQPSVDLSLRLHSLMDHLAFPELPSRYQLHSRRETECDPLLRFAERLGA